MSASVALVHDYLLVSRGAERTFAAMASCWPDAPVATLLYDAAGTGGAFEGREVRTSWLQRLGVRQRGFRRLLPLCPGAVERLPLGDPELVVSSSSAFAHGVRPPGDAVHICYCHTPFRYAWHEADRALAEVPRPARPLLRGTLRRIRHWDKDAARRTTAYIANSEITRRRIQEFWGRDAQVVHPPVEVERFRPRERRADYFVVVSEVVPHKRVDLALAAASRAGVPIKVVGDGPQREELASRYAGRAAFLGRLPDTELERVLVEARGMIVPNVEEFGIAAVEAQAAGIPVVASDAGGTRETVVDGETGILVPAGDEDAFAEALRHGEFERFSTGRLASNAARFSVASFRRRLLATVERLAGRALRPRPDPDPAVA
jgi:glycosyltransferase involved in cell wall biosynthesis